MYRVCVLGAHKHVCAYTRTDACPYVVMCTWVRVCVHTHSGFHSNITNQHLNTCERNKKKSNLQQKFSEINRTKRLQRKAGVFNGGSRPSHQQKQTATEEATTGGWSLQRRLTTLAPTEANGHNRSLEPPSLAPVLTKNSASVAKRAVNGEASLGQGIKSQHLPWNTADES